MATFRDFLPPVFTRRAERKDVGFEGGFNAWLNMPLGDASYQTGKSFAQTVSAGFSANPYMYRAVLLIARGVAGIPWLLFQDQASQDSGKQIAQHPALHLLNTRANVGQSAGIFWQYLVSDSLLAGDAFIYAVRDGRGQPTELHTLRPDWVVAKYDHQSGDLLYYEYGYANRKQRFAIEDVLHIPEINPLRAGNGIAPAKVVGRAVDQITAADDWNTALQQNSARPSGLLAPDSVLTPDQQDGLKRELQEKYGGPKNAGRPLVPRGPMKWQPMGLMPSEMDWLAGKEAALRQIATGLGIAPELLGDSAGKTFANMSEARAALYTEELFPRMDIYKGALNMWLLPMFGFDPMRYSLDYDVDKVEAIQEDRGSVWDRATVSVSAGVLTPNEAREMLGYEAVEGGDHLLIPSTLAPLEQKLEPPAPPPAPLRALPPGNIVDASSDGPPTDNPLAGSADPNGKAVMRPLARRSPATRPRGLQGYAGTRRR